jgi:hypothetical protein
MRSRLCETCERLSVFKLAPCWIVLCPTSKATPNPTTFEVCNVFPRHDVTRPKRLRVHPGTTLIVEALQPSARDFLDDIWNEAIVYAYRDPNGQAWGGCAVASFISVDMRTARIALEQVTTRKRPEQPVTASEAWA